MSFHSDLVASTAWPADLVTAGVVAATADVYVGRTARKVVKSTGEVWLERLPVEERGQGFQAVRLHAYRFHYRALSNRGGDQAGTGQVATVEAKLRDVVARYRGTRPMVGVAGLSNLVCSDAVEESVDADPEDDQVLDGSAKVTYVVRG